MRSARDLVACAAADDRGGNGRAPRRWQIFVRLAGWFLAIALIPLALAGIGAYVAYRATLTAAAESALDGIATARARQIESYMRERRREVSGLAQHPEIIDLLRNSTAAVEPSDLEGIGNAASRLGTLIDLHVRRRGYSDLLLISASGDILFSARHSGAHGGNVHEPPFRGSLLDRIFAATVIGDGTEISAVGFSPYSEDATAFIAAPVRLAGELRGVVALEVDWESVIRILEPHAGLGRTGETYLAARDGDTVIFATPLRHAMRVGDDVRLLRLGSPRALPIQRAVLGERGHGASVDYRDEPVLAAWRRLPTLGWGLVVEVDTREALLPLRELRRGLWMLGTATALMAAAAALWVARSFARPVIDLTHVADRFAAGDLGARTSVDSPDEIGGLARSFNAMADSLQESQMRLEETIDALKANNEALAESETRFRELAASIDVAFWIYDVSAPGGYVYVSPAWDRLARRDRGELTQGIDRFLETVHADDRERAARVWDEILATGSGEVVFRMERGDGAIRWMRSRVSTLPGQPGRPPRFAGVTEDITDRRAAEEALAASEAMFRRLAEATPLVPWEVDSRLGRFTYVGPQAEHLLGYPVDAWLQPGFWRSHLHPDDVARVDAACARLPRDTDGHELEYRMLAADGRAVWVHDLFTIVRCPEGTRGLRGFLVDITERKRAEAEREELLATARAAQQRAEEASRLKDEFLATVSHELRTPLNAMLGWSEVLESDDVDQETARRAIATIARNARSQARLIDDLLDISRIITGRLRLETRPIADLGAIVDAAVSSLRLAAEAREISLRIDIEPRVGPILGDPTRLQQVVWNLVSNAIKFTPRGGDVRVALARDGDRARLAVADNGEGIRPDFLPYVFDRFRQGDGGTTRTHGGLGLGLAIVRQLVEMHGGEVRAESAGVDRGATFTVVLPAMPARGVERDARRPRDAADDSAPPLHGVRVLAVDDEPDSLDLVRAILERCHIHVETASDATSALRSIAERRPDVLVADIAMPDRDGYWLIRELRGLAPERGGETPAVALTAYARTEDRAALLAAGFQRHLAKPVTAEELTGAIRDLAGRGPTRDPRAEGTRVA